MRKFVYWNEKYDNYGYTEIDEEHVLSPDKLVKYFGDVEDYLDSNKEMIVYELVPFKTLKKDVTFKFKENEA